MQRETAARARSYQSEDVTPHPSTWIEPWGVINTSLATESSDEEPPLDPNLDCSGVAFPEDQAEEEQVRMSVSSSGKDTLVTDVDPETKTDAEHIQVVDEAKNALAVAEINMATLKASLLEKDEELQKKEKLFEESQKQINELKQLVETLRMSVASLQRPVIQATVVSGMSSSSHLEQSIDGSWQLATLPPVTGVTMTEGASAVANIETPVTKVWCPDYELWLNGPQQFEEHKIGIAHKNVIRQGASQPVDAVLLDAQPVDAVILDGQQAQVFLPGKVFAGHHGVEEETNAISPMDTSPGTPQETSPHLFQGSPVALGIAPMSPPDFGDSPTSGMDATPTRTPPRSPRSGSLSVRRLIANIVTRRSPSAKR
jgi:hypothetical protein